MRKELDVIVERYFDGEGLEEILSDYASRQYILVVLRSGVTKALAMGTIDEISEFTGYKVQTLYKLNRSDKEEGLMLIRMM